MKQKPFRALFYCFSLLLALCLSPASASVPLVAARAQQEMEQTPSPVDQPANRSKTTVYFPIIVNSPDLPELVRPSDDAEGISTSTVLEVALNDEDAGLLDVTFYGRPVPVPNLGEDFTLIALPDTQFYSRWLPSIYISQTQWIVDNQEDLNIPYTAHLGDIVNTAEDTSEWDTASAAMSLLESPLPGLPDGIPYGLVPGNHDYPTTNYNNYFGVTRFTDRDYYGGHYGGGNDNNYTLFSAAGMDFIVINLEFQPGTAVLDWADTLLKNNSNRRAIVVSHSMLNLDNTWSYEGIFTFLKDNPNIFLMLCGHTHSPTDGAAQRIESGDHGNTIYILMSDYQEFPNGGNGYLRRMRFSPLDKKIYVQTYSPWLDAYLHDAENEFELDYDMTIQEEFQNLGTVQAVASGKDAAVTWVDLDLDTGYEWYVEVSEGASTTTSATWRFTTWSSPPICYALSLTKSGLGSLPTSSPDNSYGCSVGEYQAGEIITLSGASPDPGWDITGWTGTDNNNSLESTNSLTMPGANHSAGVIYADITPPDTNLTSAPSNPSGSADASFSFSSSELDVTFECQLNSGGFSECDSPKTYNGLEDGEHTFTVRAVDNAGNPDPTPARHNWTIDTTAPDTSLISAPTDPSGSADPSFSFSSSEPNVTFECQLDSGGFADCDSPKAYTRLEDGEHTFQVRAVDNAGNPDPTPASHTWTIDTTSPETEFVESQSDPGEFDLTVFKFTSSESGAVFQCRLDIAVFSNCESPQTFTGLEYGAHSFAVRSIDRAGNPDPTPASIDWTVFRRTYFAVIIK